MKRIPTTLVTVFAAGSLLAATVALPGLAGAQEDLIKEVQTGCEKELKSFCANVTPGEGRVLACLYAHGDKLSGRCEYALYDAAAKLERAINVLSYVANECLDDAEKLCAGVEMGEGRIIECLNKHKGDLDARCTQALKDTGLM
ncbi:MAG: cysteine rich repeat-containing protein [Candidatus Binatia bacterium]